MTEQLSGAGAKGVSHARDHAVHVTRNGAPYIVVMRDDTGDLIDAAIRSGEATGPSPIADGSDFPVAKVDRRAADQALAEFEAGRDAFEF